MKRDISDCFGSLDHQIMIDTLVENIHDNRFLRLVRNMLTAGYLEDWVWGSTLSGVPQGGVASPILSNIYLHRLDTFVETVLIPQYTRRAAPSTQPGVRRGGVGDARARKRGDRTHVRESTQAATQPAQSGSAGSTLSAVALREYADDHVLGFIGPKPKPNRSYNASRTFLSDDLKLELSREKTVITHARTGAAKFLGYEITVRHNQQYSPTAAGRSMARSRCACPQTVIKTKCSPYMKLGKPASIGPGW